MERDAYKVQTSLSLIIVQRDNFLHKNRKIVLSVPCWIIYLCYIDELILVTILCLNNEKLDEIACWSRCNT